MQASRTWPWRPEASAGRGGRPWPCTASGPAPPRPVLVQRQEARPRATSLAGGADGIFASPRPLGTMPAATLFLSLTTMAQPFTLRAAGDERLLESCFVFCFPKATLSTLAGRQDGHRRAGAESRAPGAPSPGASLVNAEGTRGRRRGCRRGRGGPSWPAPP